MATYLDIKGDSRFNGIVRVVPVFVQFCSKVKRKHSTHSESLTIIKFIGTSYS